MKISSIWFALLLPAFALAQSPALLLEHPEHDFGTIKQGQKVTHDFDLRNPLDHELKLTRADTSAPGMRIRIPPSLAPGGSGKVRIEWDTAAVQGRAKGEVVITLAGASPSQLRLALTGVVQPPIEFRPMRAAYFSVWARDTAEQTISIVNNDDRPLKITRIEPKGTHFEAKLQTVDEGKSYALRVTVPADTKPGRYMESVTLLTDDPRYPSIPIPVNVFVKADVYVNPETVEFGRFPLATKPGQIDLLTQTFLLKKRRGALRIESIESDVASVVITRDPPQGQSDVFKIDVALARDKLASGSLKGSLRIRTDDPEFPLLNVPITGEVE